VDGRSKSGHDESRAQGGLSAAKPTNHTH
jgi:hypothetical protein